MRLSIRFFIAFVGLTIVVLGLTLGLARISFQWGFLEFINSLEEERVSRFTPVLAEYYRENGSSWDGIAESLTGIELEGIWLNSSPRRRGGDRRSSPRRTGPDAARPDSARPDMARLDGGPSDRPRPERARPERSGPDRSGPGPREQSPRQANIPRSGNPPTGLYDLSGQRLIGSTFADDVTVLRNPISVDGEVVAEIWSSPPPVTESRSATRFSEQQTQSAILIGIISLVLAMIVSWLLTRKLLTPIKEVKNALSTLAKGEYGFQLTVSQRDELGKLQLDVNQLSKILEQNKDAQVRWIANISHELRTPLTVMSGEIEAIQSGIREYSEQSLESLASEIELLRYLVDDLYFLSTTEAGALRYHFKRVDVVSLLTSLFESVKLTAQKQGIELVWQLPEELYWQLDPERFHQVMLNLLNNSLHYTDPPGRIDIQVKTEASRLVIDIHDTAPGCSAAECAKLFEPLYRLDAARTRNQNSKGAGLGLAIVRNIVDAHNGTVEATPSPLGGLNITIEIEQSE